ncbi:hypothetical protein EJB05_05731 [Eragrostis curvula]|uniref:CASP-like protein n=1 Tax=Eragrostis curvula TaxID=38414 RepID=A0A5J9WFL8_9POAL|nr:hypothetical protein EJB05_05731 [Eragrostis curvula]
MASHPVVHPLPLEAIQEVDEEIEAPHEQEIQPPPGVPMNDLPGMAGTAESLGLRIAQLIFAAIAVSVMSSAPDFSSSPGFIALVVAFGLQWLWSVILACLDGHALLFEHSVRRRRAVMWLAAGDMLFGGVGFGAACGAAGVTTFMDNNLGLCQEGWMHGL